MSGLGANGGVKTPPGTPPDNLEGLKNNLHKLFLIGYPLRGNCPLSTKVGNLPRRDSLLKRLIYFLIR